MSEEDEALPWTSEDELDRQISYGYREGWLPSGLGHPPTDEYDELELKKAMGHVIQHAFNAGLRRAAQICRQHKKEDHETCDPHFCTCGYKSIDLADLADEIEKECK